MKNRRAVYLLLLICALIVIFTISCSTLSAVISVSSMLIELEIPPGETYIGSLRINNPGQELEEVEVRVADWNMTADGLTHFFKAGTLPQSLARWIEFSPIRFELKGGETREVKYIVTIPEGEEGTHWAILFVKGSPKLFTEKSEKGQFIVRTSFGFGIKIYQTDPNMATREGRITNMDIVKTGERSSLKVKLEFENTGDVHVKAKGRVGLRDEMGETVDQIEIKRFHILPGTKRILELPYEEEKLSRGKYLALAIIDFGGDYLVAAQRKFEIK